MRTANSLLVVERFALIYRAFAGLCHSLLKSTSQASLLFKSVSKFLSFNTSARMCASRIVYSGRDSLTWGKLSSPCSLDLR